MLTRGSLLVAALAAVTACGGATDPAGAGASAPVPGQGDDALATTLAAYRRAAGGDRVDLVQRLRATGVSFTEGDQSNRRLVLQAAPPGQFRQYEAPIDERSPQAITGIGLDGAVGWRMGTTQLAGDGLSADPAVRERAFTLAARQNCINALAGMLPLLLRTDPAISMTSLPPATQGADRGAPAIAITTADGPAGRLIFDPVTSLPAKFIAPYQRHIRAQGGEYTLVFSDFRAVDGVILPFRITRSGDAGRETQWSFSAFVINPNFAPGTFAPPSR
jgi:hypothetical protein